MKSILNKFFFRTNNLELISQRIKKISQNSNVRKIFDAINSYSSTSEIRFVGGCVRKIIIEEKVDDIDLATNLEPKIICDIFKGKGIDFFESGIEHGTITAIESGYKFEITSLRKDISTDGRYATVEFTDEWQKDAERRDFTINTIYSDLDGNLFDPFGGKKDLKDGLIKFIGDPTKRIKEDYLRILRYIRFFLGYSKNQHDKNTIKIIKQNLVGLNKVSKNRQLEELRKITAIDSFYKIYSDKILRELFLLIFPELKNISRLNKINNLDYEILSKKNFAFF